MEIISSDVSATGRDFSEISPTDSSSSSVAPELNLGLNSFSEPIAIIGMGTFTVFAQSSVKALT